MSFNSTYTTPSPPSTYATFTYTPSSTIDDSFNKVFDTVSSTFTTIAIICVVIGVVVLATIVYCIVKGRRKEQQQRNQRQHQRDQQQAILAHLDANQANANANVVAHNNHVLMVSPSAPTYHSTLSIPNDVAYARPVPNAPTDPRSKGSSSSNSNGSGSELNANIDVLEDPAIVASRIPFESLFTHTLISRGGFGEVYKGSYKGETVAVKKLLPETRRDLKHITAFFHEIKLMANMQHERIVQYIGVAWNALSDVSVVTEFMAGGDLRAMLTGYHETPTATTTPAVGIDLRKATLALHVAHALTYLHSLQPVVVHRDLKSKNILLDDTHTSAKLTDFGVSRERSDTSSTMTAAVGTVLWMAPEVMLGERYDGKADVFSFGVVLSELDTHAMPYADVKAKMASDSGRPVPDTAVLQRIMNGTVRVSFSDGLRSDIRALGIECVAREPSERPTAAQVLYRMHQICQSLTV